MSEVRMGYDTGVWGYMILLLILCGIGFLLVLKDIGVFGQIKESMRIMLFYAVRNLQLRKKLYSQIKKEYQLQYRAQKIRNRRRFWQRISRVWSHDKTAKITVGNVIF